MSNPYVAKMYTITLNAKRNGTKIIVIYLSGKSSCGILFVSLCMIIMYCKRTQTGVLILTPPFNPTDDIQMRA